MTNTMFLLFLAEHLVNIDDVNCAVIFTSLPLAFLLRLHHQR